MTSNKVYTSKLGFKFSILPIAKPAEGDVVFFSNEEWIWMQQQNLSPEEFALLWSLKKDDHNYKVIPDEENVKAMSMAEKYCKEIKKTIRVKI